MWKSKIPTSEKAKQFAKVLRKSPTVMETALWQKLRCKRMCGVRFHRQRAKLHYILDFYCPKAMLAVEVDGPKHDQQYDDARDAHLKSYGILTLRFTDRQVLEHMADVLAAIHETVTYRMGQRLPAVVYKQLSDDLEHQGQHDVAAPTP